MSATALAAISHIIDHFKAQRPLRAGSFMTTLYGDALIPWGGEVWLGNIIMICDHLGMTESHVRTAASRLVAKGDLVSARIGKKSYYRLTDESCVEFLDVANYLYGMPYQAQSQWTYILLLESEGRDDFKRYLEKAGFGIPVPGYAIRPGNHYADLKRLLQKTKLWEYCLIGKTDIRSDKLPAPVIHKLPQAWDLGRLNQQFSNFIALFNPLKAAFDQGDYTDISDIDHFLGRLILVHEYRKITLQDPRLDLAFLPENWQGKSAHQLFADLYCALVPNSERFILENLELGSGAISAENEMIKQRLKNLKPLQ